MNSTTRLLYIGSDVNAVLIEHHVPYNGDMSKRFQQDLGWAPNVFSIFLNQVEIRINQDHRLPLLHPFKWAAVPPSPAGQTFADYCYPRSIANLVQSIDWVIMHSPYVA